MQSTLREWLCTHRSFVGGSGCSVTVALSVHPVPSPILYYLDAMEFEGNFLVAPHTTTNSVSGRLRPQISSV
jgi:hypothetical protein